MAQPSGGTTADNRQAQTITDAHELRRAVNGVVDRAPVVDMHTHLFAPHFGALNLWGVDELLTYHYLIAEMFRYAPVSYDQFWALTRSAQADLIWRTLFVENTPLSEATRGVMTVFSTLGLDTRAPDLKEARAFFAEQKGADYVARVLTQANVTDVVMTNDPFDAAEADVWRGAGNTDARFHAALRIDPLVNEWPSAAQKLAARGYDVDAELGAQAIKEVRRFLGEWVGRMRPLYMAVSLPDTFAYPDDSPRTRMIREAILPSCREHDISFALMIGVKRAVNPALRIAGDGLGRADVGAVERICAEFPENKFLVSMLSRENQHALCVAARKFKNMLPFGCWWFMNNPSIITEITQQRIELLGTSFVAQHSDARILDQLLYKWAHTRRILADVLYQYYAQLLTAGRFVTQGEIARDVENLLAGNFRRWANLPAQASALSAVGDGD